MAITPPRQPHFVGPINLVHLTNDGIQGLSE